MVLTRNGNRNPIQAGAAAGAAAAAAGAPLAPLAVLPNEMEALRRENQRLRSEIQNIDWVSICQGPDWPSLVPLKTTLSGLTRLFRSASGLP